MRVIGMAEAVTQRAAFAPRIGQPSLEVVTVLLQFQRHAALADRRVARLARVAVVIAETRCRQTNETPIAGQRRTDRAHLGIDPAVELAALRGVVVVLVAIYAVGMDRQPAAIAGVDAEHVGVAVLVAAVEAHFGAAAEAVHRGLGDAPVDHVDHAADGAGAVQQRRWTLQHFDLVGQERLDCRGMVLADGGHVLGRQAVAQYCHARAVQAADDRPAHAGPEVGTLYAGQAGHGFAQAGTAHLVQTLAGQHFHRATQLTGRIPQRAGGDHHLVQILDMAPTGGAGIVACVRTGRGLPIGSDRSVLGHGQGRGQQAGQGQRERGTAERVCKRGHGGADSVIVTVYQR
ncbi:hypothetical protein XAUC_00820 [Xanthomonas citri pv. aurantifolii str. ICPB 10535]|nr:hypothetical protein XAUC_00820 [Xanthomonas citri pv. aurantifolii str. ICPB 10535]